MTAPHPIPRDEPVVPLSTILTPGAIAHIPAVESCQEWCNAYARAALDVALTQHLEAFGG